MSCDKFGLRRLKEWCSNSEEYKDFFSERLKGTFSSLVFVAESTKIDGLQCSKLDKKKNVPLVRTVKYGEWGGTACESCSNNLDVVYFFFEKER